MDIWNYKGHHIEYHEPTGPLIIDGEDYTEERRGAIYSRRFIKNWIDEHDELGEADNVPISQYTGGE